ncbi:Stealth CR1 domain-containing protein [Tenacibaculum dicentrarchi]|uniref:Capsular biosynthesis protein n=1 Tax=Tenacibaculum dicentrarchi TaxID=669041 RepID=A0ABM9NUN8_9FLAO|nr:Stealth CR1 domain-containing protein [Tenacibaculum dicentrarchi]MCD8407432.1 Stealth CR1 domain-containing protein [Tenacibaculum dicentrarchi]MCD8424805.1 Stealth CR1 domain-containing protein [Tenacibaculum dicentrarchi]MCD8434698.1 Stealth CR1 domain-containing protein [Tenacibaculum dicentrarchi]MCD8442331.1 Stealth CR1 domain-containing protein [Tenacibaculum dicentrarchi]
MQIDAVITWVDSSDELWRDKINQYLDKKIDWNNKEDSTRYNSINEIDIAIVSILKFATFIKNIYVVTDNQRPKNFNDLKEKALLLGVTLKIIDHTIIFKGYEEYLPTFNSQSIETMLYRIPNLSEHFVYFNDDMFLINKTKKTDFFIDGFPVLRGQWIKFNENILYKRIFSSKNKKNKVSHRKAKETGAKIVGFKKSYDFHHTPYPMRVSTFETFFKNNENVQKRNIECKFRHINQYVPQGLVNHLEIKNKTVIQESKLALCYIQSFNYLKIRNKILKAKIKGDKVLFMCLQSLETAPKSSLKYILKWVDKKLDSNFENEI